MERMLTAFWDEDRQEIQVRRPTGQVFRFSARQAVAGGHEVFGVQTDGNDVLVLTGAAGSRRLRGKRGTRRRAPIGGPRRSDRICFG
jgi:hypothetical protein